ncbi:FK506-binding protein 5-like [Penaeus monodon]|uniref:FK506-binding protein 5-like n=1 Tax=Penaeus monodon TaxID=6687 RepID=UPI0018A761AC|nr:FK506-binding protein 5-like [Penaeus monodon]
MKELERKNEEEDKSQTGREGSKGETNDISESRKNEITWRESLAGDEDEEKTGVPKDGWMWQQVNDEEVESNETVEGEVTVDVAQETETEKLRREGETDNQELKKAKIRNDDKPDILKELNEDKKKVEEVITDVEKTNETHKDKKEAAEVDGGIKKEKRTRDGQESTREKVEVKTREREEGKVREKAINIPEDDEAGRTKVDKGSISRKESGETGKEEKIKKRNEAEIQKPDEGEIVKEKSETEAKVEDKEMPNEEKTDSHTEGRGGAPEREVKGTREIDEGKRESRGGRGRRVFTPRQKFSEKRSRHERGDFSLTDDVRVGITDETASSGPVAKEESADGNVTPTQDDGPSGRKPVAGDMKRDENNGGSPEVRVEEACTEPEAQTSTPNAVVFEGKPAAVREDGSETRAEVEPTAKFSGPEAETKSGALETNAFPQGELECETKIKNKEGEEPKAKREVEQELQSLAGNEEGMGKREPEFEESSEVNMSTNEEDEKENEGMTHIKANTEEERENIQVEDTKKEATDEDQQSDENETKTQVVKAKREVETNNELENRESCMVEKEDGEQLKITGKEDARDVLPGKEVTEETAADPMSADHEDWGEELETTSSRKEEDDLAPLKLAEASRDTFAEDDDECIVITYRPPQKAVQRGRPREGAGVRGEADGADRSPSASRRIDEQADDGKEIIGKEGEEAKRKKTRRSKRKKVKEGSDANKKEGEETRVSDKDNVGVKGEDKKKKRPRQRKNKTEKEKVPQADLEEASKNDIREREDRAADQESSSSSRPPTRRWVEEMDEEGPGEWGEEKRKEGNEMNGNRDEKGTGGASRVPDRNLPPEVKAGEEGPSLAVEEDFLTESDALETEEDTSYYEEEGEGSSRYEMESEEGGEGGGEQNAFEEYLLLQEGECLEEMQTVDRIFRQVFEDYNDGEFLGEGEVSEGECDDSLHFLGSGRAREERTQGKSKPVIGVRVEGDGCPPPPPPSLTPPPCLITPPPPPPHSPVTPRKGRGAELKVSGPKEKRVASSELEVESKNELDVQSSRTSVPPGAEVMQEKLKRSSMRTQATQTDTSAGRKSLPTLALSPRSEKLHSFRYSERYNEIFGAVSA